MNFVERNPEKSQQEKEYERLDREYYKKFGRQYAIQMCLSPGQWEEINADIQRCLDTGEPQVLRPRVEGMVY